MLRDRIFESIQRHSSRFSIEIPRQNRSITYAEMAVLGEKTASVLGLKNDTLLILCVDKSIEAISLFVHAFLAGFSICPVDPRMPIDGLCRIVRQFRNSVVVTNINRKEALGMGQCETGDEIAEIGWSARRVVSAESAQCPEVPAYFISTSGSTGEPKLVHVPQNNVEKYFVKSSTEFQNELSMRWAQFSSMGFDLFIEDLFLTLLSGGTLVVPDGLAESARIGKFAAANRISHWNSVPSVIPRLANVALPDLRWAMFCGEPLLLEHCKILASQAPNVEIINSYCPTETALYSSEYRITSQTWEEESFATAPIGNPTCGANFFFREDEDGLRCFIMSPHIAEGYWGGDKTGFGEVEIGGSKQRYFDTGDYFKFQKGEYVFSHRKDRMVKVRGNRVDLGEVQNALAKLGLNEVAIWFSDGVIVAAFENCTLSEAEIIEQLSIFIPSYMFPGKFIFISQLPRTRSGKVDIHALREGR